MSFPFLLMIVCSLGTQTVWAWRISWTRRHQKDGGFLPSSRLAVNELSNDYHYHLLSGEGRSSAPTVPSYRAEGQSSPTLPHWSARSGSTSRDHLDLAFIQQRSEETLSSLNSWASQGIVEFHLPSTPSCPVPEKAEPSLPWSLCPHLNQTPSITCALSSPADPSANLLVCGGNFAMGRVWRPQGWRLSTLRKLAAPSLHCKYYYCPASSSLPGKKTVPLG